MSHPVTKVFTPTTRASLSFVERQALNDQLVDAIRTPGLQLVVYGHVGSGKSTLVDNKLRQLTERHVTSRCVLGTTVEQLVRDAFTQVGPLYTHEVQTKTDGTLVAKLQSDHFGLKSELSSSSGTSSTRTDRAPLPPELTPQALARLLGAAECPWVVEDFHMVDAGEKKKLANLFKLFMDTATEYPEFKIIAIGAAGTARDVISYDEQMRNRVAEVQVPLMEAAELEAILATGEGLLNVSIPSAIKRAICSYSSGLAGVCHRLALHLCNVVGLEETSDQHFAFTTEDFHKALQRYLSYSSDSLKRLFDKALVSHSRGQQPPGQVVLASLAHAPSDGGTITEIMSRVRAAQGNLSARKIKECLQQLSSPSRGPVLRFDPDSERYAFVNPLYRAYAHALFSTPRDSKQDVEQGLAIDLVDISRTIEEMLARLAARTK